jgi:methanogenic corrinoid protein MtbC1
MIMSQLYPFIFSAEKNGWKMVAASVDSNMHDIGIRMVADFFEMNGWDTFYLGANAPHQAILEAVQSYAPNLVAISATISRQVLQVEQAINGIRELPGGEKIMIIVGGAAFNTTKDLWKQIKADGYAVSADGAVELANRLIKDSRS